MIVIILKKEMDYNLAAMKAACFFPTLLHFSIFSFAAILMHNSSHFNAQQI